MTGKRLLRTAALALVAAAAVPAAAQAGAGPGDDLSDAITPPPDSAPFIRVSTATDPHIAGFEIDTSAYTTEAGEPSKCPQRTYTSDYAKTAWATFKAPQFGRLDATAAGFDSVIALFDSTANGAEIACTDRLASKIESFSRDALPTVKKNHTYYVQVGGAQQQDGSIPGGPLSVDLELIRPLTTDGDAVLTWVSGRGGVKIKSLKLVAPRGSIVIVGCLRKSCGKVKGYGVTKPVFSQKIGGVNFARRLAGPAPAPAKRAIARSAAKPNLKGKRIKNGDTLLVAIQREDEIGVVYSWTVKRNAAGTKSVHCLEPDTSRVKIRKVGACTGR